MITHPNTHGTYLPTFLPGVMPTPIHHDVTRSRRIPYLCLATAGGEANMFSRLPPWKTLSSSIVARMVCVLKEAVCVGCGILVGCGLCLFVVQSRLLCETYCPIPCGTGKYHSRFIPGCCRKNDFPDSEMLLATIV